MRALSVDLKVIEPTQEQQIGDLLDHFERVGNAARPEGVPYLVNLTLNTSCNHNLPLH
ncbi:MAG TPA: hypothetical protein VHZ51_13820 [Ktedonobacteraceae bacterium]|nr:hypothetical protein [Ktedonobacteraceae bacterium]